METPSLSHPLNRREIFRWLIAQEVARRGGSSEDQLIANAWTLGMEASSISPAIGLAARQHVDAVLPEPELPPPMPEPARKRGRPKLPKRVKVRAVPAAVLEREWRVMHMRDVGHLRFKDIARRMGLGPGRVRSVYGKAHWRRMMANIRQRQSVEAGAGQEALHGSQTE